LCTISVANRVEKELKENLRQQGVADDSLQIEQVADRFMRRVGDYHTGRDSTERLVELLVKYFGKPGQIDNFARDV
jgi:predicted component of type VI protein secretion system